MKNQRTLLLVLSVTLIGVILELNDIGDPYPAEQLYLLGGAALIPAAILSFCRAQIFNSWIKLISWWMPISVLLIIVIPEGSNDWFNPFFVGKEDVTWLMSGLFLLISLVLIAWKSFPFRKTS